jgi:HAE1 family hydrophobic/amphiphilic exporter-1
MKIQGLQSIISANTEGQTQITLTFNLNKTVDLAAPDVQAAISNAQGNLPDDLPQPPSYSKNNPSDAPVIYIMVTSDTLTPGQLYDYGNTTIGQRLSMLEGVSDVDVYGAKSAMRVRVDPQKLASFQIGLDQVKNALVAGTVTTPGGSLNGRFRTFSIEPEGQLLKAEQYNDLIVTYKNDSPIRVSDIGKAYHSQEDDVIDTKYAEAGGHFSSGPVLVMVHREGGSNTVALVKRVMDTLKELEDLLPGSVKISILYDKSVTIKDSINDVKFTLFLAFVLVVLVIFLFLGRVSDTIIPGIALPLSMICTFIAMYLAGFSLDNLSLMALTLAVGFVVDDAIVVLENTVRLIEEGEQPLAAAIKSAHEITGTVISMTLSLVTVFIPLVFMGGVIGRTFREFALTVVAAIVCSGIVSLTLTPMMCARMLKPATDGDKKNLLQRFTDSFVGTLTKGYGVMLKWVLLHKFVSVLIWLGCLVGTWFVFGLIPQSFLPEGDSGVVQGEMLVPQGTSTDQIRIFQHEISQILLADPSIKNVFTATGLQAGADQSTGMLVFTLIPQDKRKSIQEVVQELRVKFATMKFPLGYVFMNPIPVLKISAGGESTATGAKYSYTINGKERDKVYECAQKVKAQMEKLPEFVGIQTTVKLNMPQLSLKILRDRASTYGVTAADIENALADSFAQGRITTYKTDSDIYNVVIEVAKKYQRKPEDLQKIYVRSSQTGKLVPLESVVLWTETVGPQGVPHSDRLNSATLSFNLKEGYTIGQATKSLEKAAADIMPPGVTGAFQGEAQMFQEAVSSMGILIAIAIFLMYVILGVLYESYIHPMTVLTTLPVAAFGGLATLFIFNSELSLYAYVGLFMLLGIVAKNGIMMVDFANQMLEEDGEHSGFDAIYHACLIRFRPILMTGVAAIMGAVPIAIGVGADGASRRPLGLIVVGGLAFSQVITLFVTPGIYLYMEKFQEKFLDRFELSRSDAARRKLADNVVVEAEA